MLGAALTALGQPNEALHKYQFHYAVAEEMQDKGQMCEACSGLGLVFQVNHMFSLLVSGKAKLGAACQGKRLSQIGHTPTECI